MGQKKHFSIRQRYFVGTGVVVKPFAKAQSGIPEVVFFEEAGPIPSVVAGERRDRHHLRYVVDIERDHKYRIGELVAPGKEATMAKRAGVNCGLNLHHSTPKVLATRNAEFSPSSWKP